jgi:hypothetical protein
MKRRNNYISDKLIYSGERLKSHQEQAIAGELETRSVPAPAVSEYAAGPAVSPEKPSFTVERKHFEEYARVRREQLLRLAEFSALLEAELTDCRQTVGEAEKLQLVFDQFFQELSELPESFNAVNQEPEKFTSHNRNLEQARLVIIRHAATVRKLLSQGASEKNGNTSVVHEIASLSFLQLLRLGLGLALPVFFGIILAALIIGTTIIMTMGGV